MSNTKLQVRVLRPIVMTEQFETASWSREIELQPGVYPMSFVNYGSWSGHTVRVPGTVVSSAFPSSFCGNQFGDGNRDKDKGQARDWEIKFVEGSFFDGRKERAEGAIVIEEAA